MLNSTTNTYILKREILTFSKHLSKPDRKFTADMTYGMLASGSCLLTDIVDSDVIKPEGRKFEALGLVLDGSNSTDAKNGYEKGYHVTETYLSHVKVQITASKKDINLAHISMKPETNALKVSIIQKADPIKEKVYFCYYRLAKGISGIPSTLP